MGYRMAQVNSGAFAPSAQRFMDRDALVMVHQSVDLPPSMKPLVIHGGADIFEFTK